MLGGLPAGRWFGFRVRIDPSWFVVFALVLWTFSTREFPARLAGQNDATYWVMGACASALFFLSLLLHELSHSAVARARGIPVEGITLFIFGGVARMRMEARRPVDEFLLTIVGPLSSVLIGGVFFAAAVAADFFAWHPAIEAVAALLAVLNIVLAVFNLVPAFPLDGGRLLRSTLWQLWGDLERATRWATRLGRGFGYLLMAFGAILLAHRLWISGVWAVLIGGFLVHAATASYRQFRRQSARPGLTAAPGSVMPGSAASGSPALESPVLESPTSGSPAPAVKETERDE